MLPRSERQQTGNVKPHPPSLHLLTPILSHCRSEKPVWSAVPAVSTLGSCCLSPEDLHDFQHCGHCGPLGCGPLPSGRSLSLLPSTQTAVASSVSCSQGSCQDTPCVSVSCVSWAFSSQTHRLCWSHSRAIRRYHQEETRSKEKLLLPK